MNNSRKTIYLAALLHDIGKFFQRADPDFASSSKLLSQNVKKLEGSICPLNPFDKKYSHKHVLWTAQFFENIESLTKTLIVDKEIGSDKLLRIAAAHHNPGSFLETIIQKADHYSSGADRVALKAAWDESTGENSIGFQSYKTVAMRSVFEGVGLNDHRSNAYKYVLPLVNISLTHDYFPISSAENKNPPNYNVLWNDFMEEINTLERHSLDSFIETVYYLLEKYTSRIPSSTLHLPDVSLFDHLKTTAAFALCLYDYCEFYELDDIKHLEEQKPFLLVGGDVSGIQKFIYNIIARGAAKNLKGRSFYLQLLVDTIIDFIIKELGLYSGNIVYGSGGSFYILAPNTDTVRQKLCSIENLISKKLFKEHGANLSLAFDHIAFGEKELYGTGTELANIGEAWKMLVEKLGKKKGNKFAAIVMDEFDTLFEPESVDKEQRDAITMDELKGPTDSLGDNIIVNRSTFRQIQLGKQLKNTQYWIISSQELPYLKNTDGIEPLELGIHHYFISRDAFKNSEDKLKQSADRVKVIYFNNEDFAKTRLIKGTGNTYGYAWYGGNDYPRTINDEQKDFAEMCGGDPNEETAALTRLGVLRMDVDNLGLIFKDGFAANMRTFSRYSALSRNLDYFFKGYINEIWQRDAAYKAHTQIIYSGGDDLFIVGKWDVLTRIAVEIKNEFSYWTCHNPQLSISGGMASVTAKFPILKAAEFSDDFEKAAKMHKYGLTQKNSFCFVAEQVVMDNTRFNRYFAFNWEHEMTYVTKLKNELLALQNTDDGLASGIASDLLNLVEKAHFEWDKNNDRYLPTVVDAIWLVAYSFKRAQKNASDYTQKFYTSWMQNIMTGKIDELPDTGYHPLQLLAIAARWAAYEKRSELKKQDSYGYT